MKLSKRLLSVELVTGSVRLKGEQMRLSKRLLSVELVTISVRLKEEQMRLSKRLLSVELYPPLSAEAEPDIAGSDITR